MRLRAPEHLVSPRARWLWRVSSLGAAVALAVPQVGWWLTDRRGAPGPHVTVGVITGLLWIGYAVLMPEWRYRVHRWEATPTAVFTQTGWITQERRIAPISRVQTVDLTRGPLAQLLGLASVRVTTASAAGPLAIHGLDHEVAQGLVEALTRAAEAERGDAT